MAGFWLLLLLVAAHAGAALYHHFIQRDDTMRRMLPLPVHAHETSPQTLEN